MKKGDEVIALHNVSTRNKAYRLKKDKTYTVSGRYMTNSCNGVRLEQTGLAVWHPTLDVIKVEPQTNALSKELASKVMWEEKVKHPGLQEKELNPKVFSLTEDF